MAVLQLMRVVDGLIDFYGWLVIIWCLLSWFPIREGSLIGDIATVINRIVSPYMNLFRRFIPPIMGIDFSPIIGLMVLQLVRNLLVRVLAGVL